MRQLDRPEARELIRLNRAVYDGETLSLRERVLHARLQRRFDATRRYGYSPARWDGGDPAEWGSPRPLWSEVDRSLLARLGRALGRVGTVRVW